MFFFRINYGHEFLNAHVFINSIMWMLSRNSSLLLNNTFTSFAYQFIRRFLTAFHELDTSHLIRISKHCFSDTYPALQHHYCINTAHQATKGPLTPCPMAQNILVSTYISWLKSSSNQVQKQTLSIIASLKILHKQS